MKILFGYIILILAVSQSLHAQDTNPLSIYLDKSGSLRYIDFYEDYQLIRIRVDGELLIRTANSREITWGGQVTQIYFYGKYSYEIKYSFGKVEQISVRETDKEIVFDYFFNQLKSVYVRNDTNRKIVMKYFIDELEKISGGIPGVAVYVDLTGN